MLSMMRKCIMVRVGKVKKTKKNKNRGKFIDFAEIGRHAICIIRLGGDGRP